MRLTPSIVLLRTQTDERLVALAGEGSDAAFTALVERYRRLVLRACMRVLPESRAEDATQQVFMAAWNALRRGDDVRAVRPWLLRIARNTALNALRTPGFEYDELAESLQGGTAPQAELEKRDVMRQTLRGLAALPENQREALLRTAVQGASHADIARDLGISEGATRQLVLRARANLRAAVSVLTPLPLLHWAAKGHAAPIAQVAAGGSTAGVASLAKVGAVVVLAGGAAATPAVVHQVRQHQATASETVASAATAGQPTATATAEPHSVVSAVETATAVALRKERRREKAVFAGTRRHHGRSAHTHRADVATGASGSANAGEGNSANGQSRGRGKGQGSSPAGTTNPGKHTAAHGNPVNGKGKGHNAGSHHASKTKPVHPKPVKPTHPKPVATPKPKPRPTPQPTPAQPTPTPTAASTATATPSGVDHGAHAGTGNSAP